MSGLGINTIRTSSKHAQCSFKSQLKIQKQVVKNNLETERCFLTLQCNKVASLTYQIFVSFLNKLTHVILNLLHLIDKM